MWVMRKAVLVAVCLLAAACSGGHSKTSNDGGPTTVRVSTPPTTVASAVLRAQALCHSELHDVFSAQATTVGGFQDTTTGGTRPPSQDTMYPSFGADSFGAWCWTGHGPYNVYEVTSDGKAHLIASQVVVAADEARGAPPRVP